MKTIKENKLFTSVIAAIIVLGLGFIIYDSNFGAGSKVEENTAELDKDAGINRSTVEEVKGKISSEDIYAFIVGADTCPACVMYKTSLKELVADEGIKLDYIDLDVSSDDEVLAMFKEIGFDISEGFSTPTTFIIVDGELTSTVVGAVSVEELLEKHGDELRQLSSIEGNSASKESNADKE